MNEQNKKELVDILDQMGVYLKEFETLQKITNANKNGKIKLSDKKFEELENKYKELTEKMADLNARAKKLQNNE